MIILFCCSFLAPGEPPQNVTIDMVTPTSIRVSWEDPPPEDQNGIIIMYLLNYTNLNQSETVMVDTTNMNITIEGLEEFEVYNVTVAAVTVAEGPFSPPESVTTSQAGE